MKQQKYVLVKAAPLPNQPRVLHEVGFCLSASRPKASIAGIHGKFQADKDFRAVFLPSLRELFFYGSMKDFQENLGVRDRNHTAIGGLFRRFPHPDTQGNSRTAYAKIPLREFDLDDERADLLGETYGFFRKFLSELQGKLQRKEIPQDRDSKNYKSLVSALKRFDPDILSLALQAGYFFTASGDNVRKYRKEHPIITVQTVGQIPVPRYGARPRRQRDY